MLIKQPMGKETRFARSPGLEALRARLQTQKNDPVMASSPAMKEIKQKEERS